MSVKRKDVIDAYRFILGREPENEEVIRHHMQLPDIEALRQAMLNSEEFRRTNKLLEFGEKWVAAEIFENYRIWLNLADKYVSYGCLINDYEPHETRFVREHLKPGQTFVDIGANIGWFTMLAASIVGTDGKVISIEPRGDIYRYLVRSVCENHLDNIVEYHRCALSDKRGYTDIMWAANTDNPGGTHIGTPSSEGFNVERVLTLTLDEVMNERTCDFIKIDVEGAEPLVFAGAAQLLERCSPVILSELFPEQLHTISNSSAREYIALMRKYGYKCYLLEDEVKEELRDFPEGYHKELCSVVFVVN